MKNKLLSYSLTVACLAIFSACEKKEELKISESPKIEELATSNKVNIDTLKSFMFEITNIPVSQIVYEPKAEKFFFLGAEQFTKENLTKYYFNIKGNK